ncbi:hypothetical protein ESCO_002128 [Escovopsis weberi]|uniref:Uncharacterized protein n=1 Tax=Escovopsis weberi TaxID=150374 RepID=A0A0M8N033_ESCWE|nr:hypothetical protein ESCO_002128 [Escovopsis weberi]
MKSTSSRFSFDMIGSANQEKLLEDRHRQREMGKKAAAADAPRNSMYDDFDEDGFDYDAMMDDGGLEERIPGVNADYDDDKFYDEDQIREQADPDDDQENFAGFVFQRSNPGSSATPVQLTTAGHGFTEDDLYFGGDLTGFEDDFAEDLAAEPDGDGVPFDESIFDDNDTDQFGRPLPGAFALAHRRQSIAERAESGVAVGDGTGLEEKAEEEQEDEEAADEMPCAAASSVRGPELVAPIPTSSSGSVEAVYQAALAAAAQKAAASGKFERSKSPGYGGADDGGEPLGDLDPLDPLYFEYQDPSEDFGYVDDGIGDDYELDDDAIIAEANASALANDADGWYGQEFGFYSAPINIHGSQNAGVDYSYANGGFFGPKGLGGLDRSASGRVASREPNLTPITERSEYSNRNSVMSLGVPNGNSGTPTMQSPGLAQLAMLADRGDDLTLSALLRLRSRAWGDSQASLVSSSKDGSPRSDRGGEAQSSPRGGHFAGQHLGSNGAHGRKNSVFSVGQQQFGGGRGPGIPGATDRYPWGRAHARR